MDRIRRRDFLVASGAAAAVAVPAMSEARAAPALAAPAISSGVRELRLAMPWPDDIAGFGDSAARLARRVEHASGGRFKVTAETVVAANAADGFDLAHGFEHARVASHPAFAYFAGLPGFAALNALDLDAWLAVGGGQDLWDDLGAEIGVKPLLAGHTGRWPGFWSRKRIDGLADFAGVGVLALGLTRDVAAGLGAKPVDAPIDAWPGVLASGAAMGAELGGAQGNMALGLAPHTKHVFGFGLAPAGATLVLGVRRSLWDGLGGADQALFAACAGEEFRLTLSEARAHETVLRKVLEERHGVASAPFPEDVTAALSGVADAVIAHAAGTDPRAARIDASYMAFRHAVTGMERPAPPSAPVSIS